MSYDGGRITPSQIFFMTAGSLYGTTSILVRTGPAEQDTWLAIIFAGVIGFIYMFMYLAILKRFPGQTIIEIAQIALGKTGGTVFGLLFSWYPLHLSALVVRLFAELLKTSFLPETPLVIFILSMLILSSVAVRSGIETIARSSEVFIVAPIVVPFFLTILAIANGLFIPSRLLPILNHDFKTMAWATTIQTAFPFGETVVLTMVLGLVTDFARGTRAVLWSMFLGLLMGLSLILREIGVLGTQISSHLIFPVLTTLRLIHLGEFLTRIDAIFIVTWMAAIFVKFSLSQYAATVSLGQILGLATYRPLTFPIAGLIGGLSVLVFPNTLEMIKFLPYYGLYTFPFQFVLPLLLLIMVRGKQNSSVHRTGVPGG